MKIDEEGQITWLEAFTDLTDDQFQAAIRGFVANSTEFPSPAAVRKYAGSAGINETDRVTIAWNAVRTAIRDVGGYSSPDFDDHAINAAIREMGGWVLLCESQTDDLKWREQEFRRNYLAALHSGIGNGSPLSGICDRTNAKLGYSPQQPAVRIETRLPVSQASRKLERVLSDSEALPASVTKRIEVASVGQTFADRMREVLAERPKPVVKRGAFDRDEERSKLVNKYPEVQS